METKYDEKRVEKIFWYISIFTIAISPLAMLSLYKNNLTLSYNAVWFPLVIFGGLPLALFNDFIIGLIEGNLKLWIVHPSAKCQHKSSLNLELTLHEVISRLKNAGFLINIKEQTNDFIIIDFNKSKNNPVSKFLDGAFRGSIKLTAQTDLTDIYTEITFLDTVIIETGELRDIQTLCNYLGLKVKEYRYCHVPFILYCGLDLALLTIFLSFFYSFYPTILCYILAAASFGAIGFALFSIGLIYFDPQYLFGYRLAIATIYLGSISFITFLLKQTQIAQIIITKTASLIGS